MNPQAVSIEFEISRLAAGTALRRLRKKGCVTVTGATNSIRYTATDVKPEDMRGTAPNTVAALLHYCRKRVRHDKRKFHPYHNPTHPLDRAIGLKRNRREY
jgi:hypothetical protein